MKKVFISCPFKGQKEETVKGNIRLLHQYAENHFHEELEAVHNYQDYDIPEGASLPIYCLGEAIKKMASVDYFIGVEEPNIHRGCMVESNVAKYYNIPSIYVPQRWMKYAYWKVFD